MQVDAVLALVDRQIIVKIELPENSTVARAMALLRTSPAFAGIDLDALPCGVYGERCPRDRVLVDGDRLEFYRPLVRDAKERRRAIADKAQDKDRSR